MRAVRLSLDCLIAMHSGVLGHEDYSSLSDEPSFDRLPSGLFMYCASIRALRCRLEDSCRDALSKILRSARGLPDDGLPDLESAWHSAQEAAIDSRFLSYGLAAETRHVARSRASGSSEKSSAESSERSVEVEARLDEAWIVVGDSAEAAV